MQKTFLTAIVAAGVTIFPIDVFPSVYLDSTKAHYLVQVQQLLHNDKFHQAELLSTAMIEKYPGDPVGYLFKAVTLISEMFDNEEKLHTEQFHQLLDTALSRATNIADTASSSTCAWMSLFSGHAKAYRALWESRFGSFVNAIKLGRQAKSEYERGLAYDSGLYDLYFGLGLYHYWKSAKAGFLRSLGLIKDERDKGVAELYLAAESSIISQESARSALVWIYMDKKEYDSVVASCLRMLKKYPDGKTLLWPLARAYFQKKDYRNALTTFQLLRERVAKEPGNFFNLTECDYYLYRCCEKLALKREAGKVAHRVQQYYERIPQDTRRRQRSKIALLRRAAKI